MGASGEIATTPARAPRGARLAGLWLVLPVLCHWAYSWMGFNPTDDGWMPAVSRRIWDGEVPHRDFIFVRPALSAILEIPLVVFGGDHVIWLSRLWGWLTIGAIAWLWTGIVVGTYDRRFRFAMYVIVFVLTANVFDVMAWHTLDGMLFCTLALHLARRRTPVATCTAFVLVGLAALCRQNFACFGPFLALLFLDRRTWPRLLWAALPAALYLGWLALVGGARDCLVQVFSSRTMFFQVAIQFYGNAPFLGGTLLGIGAEILLRRRAARWAGLGLWLLGVMAGAACLAAGADVYYDWTYVLFGFVLAVALLRLRQADFRCGEGAAIAFGGLALAWVVSISVGVHNPSLMSGVLVALSWALLLPAAESSPLPAAGRFGLVLAAMVAVGVGFSTARQRFPYRDRPAAELAYEVGDVLPGGAGLRTNAATYAIMAELRALTQEAEREKRPYGILTDGAAHWIRSRQRNLLLSEWPQPIELGNAEKMMVRFGQSLLALPPGTRFLLQRCAISEVRDGLRPVPEGSGYYLLQDWVRSRTTLESRHRFFDVYVIPPRPPRAPADGG